MRRSLPAVVLTAASLLVGSIALAPVAGAEPSDTGLTHRNVAVCAAPAPGAASCDAVRRDTSRNGKPVTIVTPDGHGPDDIASAYGLSQVRSTGTSALSTVPTAAPVVAVIDAYDHPNAAADLTTYRTQFTLPACSTTTSPTSCFRKVNQSGKASPLPRANAGWGQEISLDLDMVSAACPACRILLVEANSNSFADLAAAAHWAATQPDVVAISNSYGGAEVDGSTFAAQYGASYEAKNKAVTASTGDSGYGVQFPAALTNVVAVGGTSLYGNRTDGWTQAAWSGAGSGCSTTVGRPDWQAGVPTGCGMRASADVSAVADPQTGVAVYDSVVYQGRSGWMVFGGTSASAPIVAAAFAQASKPLATYPAQTLWANAAAAAAGARVEGLRDVVGGDGVTNGTCPAGTPQWCQAAPGWDGPTGLGTPYGTSALVPAPATTS